MYWQITFLVILARLSAQMHSHQKADRQNLNLSSENVEVYNIPFSMHELKDVLRRAHDTSAGPDKIHYQLLKHLPNSSFLLLLNIFNIIWISGEIPSDWRKASIIHQHRSYTYNAFIHLKKDHPPQCEHCQCILTVATFWWSAIILLKKGDIFGGRDVVESFWFQPTLILFYLKECQFYKF